MNHPFQVSAKEIQIFRDADFVSFMKHLLAMEVERCGADLDGLDITWQEKAPDGGIDASVEGIESGQSAWLQAGTSI